MKYKALGLVTLSLLVLGAACGKKTDTTNTNTTTVTNTAATTNVTPETNPEGTILVEGGDGTLSGAETSTMNFIGEIASGRVAYLGSKGATATYTVTAITAGTYSLAIKTSDDGAWNSGYRDANVTVNGMMVVTYQHVTQDTRGLKWFTVGNVSLKAGANTVAFTKANDMPAAFTLNQMKFTPVILQ